MESTTLICVLIIIFTILIIYLYNKTDSPDNILRDNYQKHLKNSSGEFDDDAKKALKNVEKIKNKSLADLYTEATIIDKYKNNTNLTRTDKKEILRLQKLYGNIIDKLKHTNKNNKNNFIKNKNKIQNNLQNNQNNLQNNQNNLQNNIFATTTVEQNLLNTNLDPEILLYLNSVDDFNQRLIDQNVLQVIPLGINTQYNSDKIKLNNAKQKIQNISTNSTKANTAKIYFAESAKEIANDTQNAHDSAVNKHLRIIYDIIKRDYNSSNTLPIAQFADICRGEIEHIMYNGDKNTDDKNTDANTDKINKNINIKKVLDKIYSSESIIFDDVEKNILAMIWWRTKMSENANNKSLMESAILDVLADSVENNTVVCPNGRMSRVMSALVLLDVNKNLSNMKTIDLYHSEIMNKCAKIYNTALINAKNSDNPLLRDVAESYLDDPNKTTDITTENNFKNEVRREMREFIESYRGEIGDNKITQFINECNLLFD
jgi:hypothetical protein